MGAIDLLDALENGGHRSESHVHHQRVPRKVGFARLSFVWSE